MEKVDYLIVGQGIAGSLLSYFLLREGKSVKVIDQYNPDSSSRVAAGMFNPITGRRFVKTWLADEIFPFAEQTYTDLEKELNKQFYFPNKIVRTLADPAELKEWRKKSQREDYEGYMSPLIREGDLQMVEILQSGNVDIRSFVDAYRDILKALNLLIEEKFYYDDVELRNNVVYWNTYEAEKLIFCEGFRAMQNPWFGSLPFTHAKGEIINIRSESLKLDHILTKGIFVLPIGNDVYRIGATYDWDDLTEKPTEKGKRELVEKLDKILDVNYTIIGHKASIRPTVKDRRPLIGLHPKFQNLGIFNGLGTKGVSLGPYFAKHFVDYLMGGQNLNPEADIHRFLGD